MSDKRWIDDLRTMGACRDALAWAEASGYDSLEEAWLHAPGWQWHLWYVGRIGGKSGTASHRRIVAVACECARLILPQWETRFPIDRRPHAAIEAAERYASGEDVSVAYLCDAAAAAYAAGAAAAADAYAAGAYAAYADAADAAAAAAAADAAYAAYAAADAAAAYAADAAYAAYADAYAAYAAVYAAAYAADVREIVLRHYPTPPRKEAT